MFKPLKKTLRLNRETLRCLAPERLGQVAAGLITLSCKMTCLNETCTCTHVQTCPDVTTC
jgi:hypothetical protein